MKILDINALQILDSRANPAIQVEVLLIDGSKGVFAVPSGASKGIHEAHELRDENKNIYFGKGVEKAIENIHSVKNQLVDIDLTQRTLDELLIKLDGTENKSAIGANAILGISCAFAKALAMSKSLPLHKYLNSLIDKDLKLNSNLNPNASPHLFANIINGGLHSGNGLKIQEFMIVPHLESLQLNVRAISEIYNELKNIIKSKYGSSQTALGDEGGFAPEIDSPTDALDLITLAISNANYDGDVKIALDCAASDFYDKKTKKYEVEPGLFLNYKDLSKYYEELINKYPIISIEDPMAEDDFDGFAYFTKTISKIEITNPISNEKSILVVGDDLTVTNSKRIDECIKKKLCNSLLLKINQIGTLTESINAFEMVSKKGWQTIVSHRSGETTDSLISDLAVAMTSSIKLGAPARGERVAKYNRLLEIFSESN